MIGLTTFVCKDIVKNKIVLFYAAVLAIFAWSVLHLEDTSMKSVLSLLNIILLTVPLMAIIFSTIYLYNSAEFIELLVSQPVKRSVIWSSLWLGLTLSLNLAFLLSVGLPVLLYIPDMSGLVLIVSGMMITTIFVSIAMLCAILMKDKARGIGMAILFWLFLSLIYDGLVLFFMFQLSDYPIENGMVILSAANPVDLARIMVILQVDVAALMGYTGAIFKKLFGTNFGMILSFFIMVVWVAVPFIWSLRKFTKKDL